MIRMDLHTHTDHSHGRDSVETMFAKAVELDLEVYGFSEHSPRPDGYTYPHEYREHLAATFDDYARSVLNIQQESRTTRVLFGLELDYLPHERLFMEKAKTSWPFDYLIGGIHFLDIWGFDATQADWVHHSRDEIFTFYDRYFSSVLSLAQSGLVNILAHPDIIKIFTVETFRTWLTFDASLKRVEEALTALKDNGMAMEISSAGLRKPCREIYPCPEIMALAAKLDVPITFASDAHSADVIAWGFDKLAEYAGAYGYTQSVFFHKGVMCARPF